MAFLTSSEATAAAPIVEALDTNVMATSNDVSDTCSLHESDEETVVAAEMRESADAKDEAKDSMADNNKHTAASDDCKSSDDNTMLSAEGPSFHLDNAPGSVSTTVAVTPFKAGKGPPLNGLPVSLPLLSDNVTNTVAVTPSKIGTCETCCHAFTEEGRRCSHECPQFSLSLSCLCNSISG